MLVSAFVANPKKSPPLGVDWRRSLADGSALGRSIGFHVPAVSLLELGTQFGPFEPREQEANGWKFRGKAWLFMGAPKTANLLYDEDFLHYEKEYPDNFRYTKAISREQQNAKGGRMYIQDRVLEHAEEIFAMIEDPKTHVYMCGLRGMEPGIDEAMTAAAAAKGLDWAELRPQLKKADRWHVETY